MTRVSAEGRARHLTDAADSAEPKAEMAAAVGGASAPAPTLASSAAQGWSTVASGGGGTARTAGSGTTTDVQPITAPAANAVRPTPAPPSFLAAGSACASQLSASEAFLASGRDTTAKLSAPSARTRSPLHGRSATGSRAAVLRAPILTENPANASCCGECASCESHSFPRDDHS